MAVAIANTTTGNSTTPGSAWDTSVVRASGEGFVVGVLYAYQWAAPDSITSIVWDPSGDNQSMTQIGTATQMNGENRYMAMYYLAAPTTAKTGNVRVNFSGSINDHVAIIVRHVTGHDTGSMVRDYAATFGESAAPSVTTTSQSGDLVIDMMAFRLDEVYLTADSPQANSAKTSVITWRTLGSSTKAGASSVTMSWTSSGGSYDWAIKAASIAPGVAVPTAPSGTTAGNLTANSASISWTDDSSDETGFKVRYTPSPYSSNTTATASVAASPYVITGLTDNTSYKAAVAAFNGAGDSTWVESGVFTTTALTKLRPSADTSTGSWSASSGSVLYTMIDESVADDADYITTSTNTVTKIKLETATDPGSDANHALRIRARSTSGTLTVRLVQGNPAETTIVSWVPTLTSSFATYDYNLTTAEASVITDYSALYVKFTTS